MLGSFEPTYEGWKQEIDKRAAEYEKGFRAYL